MYHIEVLASHFLSYFLHIPDILFSVLPLNLLACTSSREPRGYCAICGLCARFAIDVNMEIKCTGKIVFLENATDNIPVSYSHVFKMTENIWQINSTIQHRMILCRIPHKAFSQCSSKSVHSQYNELFDIFTFISQV